jgi:hypothetical protein
MLGKPILHPWCVVMGFVIFVSCGYLANVRVERWRKANGVAPPPSMNRAGNREYKAWLRRNMPEKIKRDVRLLQFGGFVIAAICLWLSDKA